MENVKELAKKSVKELVMDPTPRNLRALEYKICQKDEFYPEMDLWRLEYDDNIDVTLEQVKAFDHDTPEFSVVSFVDINDSDSMAIWLNAKQWGWLRIYDSPWEDDYDEYDSDEEYDPAWENFNDYIHDHMHGNIHPLTELKFQQLYDEALGGYTAQPIGSEVFPVCTFDYHVSSDMKEAIGFLEDLIGGK